MLKFAAPVVIVVPVTVKSPPIVRLLPTVTLLGRPIVTVLSVTVVSISFAVPAKVSVSDPTVTLSVPVPPAIASSVEILLVSLSTYAFVAASCALVGSTTLIIFCVFTSKSALGANVSVTSFEFSVATIGLVPITLLNCRSVPTFDLKIALPEPRLLPVFASPPAAPGGTAGSHSPSTAFQVKTSFAFGVELVVSTSLSSLILVA